MSPHQSDQTFRGPFSAMEEDSGSQKVVETVSLTYPHLDRYLKENSPLVWVSVVGEDGEITLDLWKSNNTSKLGNLIAVVRASTLGEALADLEKSAQIIHKAMERLKP